MDNKGYPDYRWVIFALIILCVFTSTLVFASIVPILGFLISDLNISVILAGLLMSVASLMTGFSMFIFGGMCTVLIKLNIFGQKKTIPWLTCLCTDTQTARRWENGVFSSII